ncbi:MFS transporter [Natrinema hispanicum]|uniref:dolichyl-phosphooligosaccharide-protein glycotransferase n=1 Tax=Natrinema hispanicum TaxID=392421 RepID=A0A1I0J6P8_9EURY|nr:MFS transporter [Natrinema hispanicum]SEU04861.1 dolichyl-diphosphooligosaccharide--protein glycosyltransferase [Natrinema hispanicum]
MSIDGDSGDIADAAASFLEEHDNGDRALKTVLAADVDHETWTFDDVDLDSGTFGELVSRGIVTKVDGAYQVADPAVVESVLTGEELGKPTDDNDLTADLDRFWNDADLRALAALFGALLTVAIARMTAYQSVFQNGYVISPGNDPYYFRYWMENLLEQSSGPADYGVLVEPQHGVAIRRPLAHATNWFIAELLGGGQGAADTVAAWLPIVASVVLGLVVYKLTVLLTRDVRVGVASVLAFAVTPIHAVYTGLGFIDHQLHQYFWLGITLLTLTWLAVDLQRRLEHGVDPHASVRNHLRTPLTWIVALGFGLSVAAGIHSWGGSPLLLMPLAGYVAFRVAMDARADISPALANLPLLIGLAVGSWLSLALHHRWGWHAEFVATTPMLVLGGAIAVVVLGELWRRVNVHLSGLFTLEGLVAAGGLYVFKRLQPDVWAEAMARVDDLFFREGITETLSLFSTEYAVFFGPMYQLGMGFYVALLVLVWVIWRVYRQYEPGWLLVGTYSGYLLLLAGIQVRFAGQLAIPLAVLTGLGLVQLLSVVELARTPVPFLVSEVSASGSRDSRPVTADGGQSLEPSITLPNGRAIGYLLGVGLLVFGLSLIYVPGLTADVTHSEAQVEAMGAIDDHAETANRTYPENYVLSEWGDNRMYNHFVNGESQGYGYAQRNYGEFRSSSDPDSWYDQFDGRVGYVVVTAVDEDAPAEGTQVQLLEQYSAGGNGTDGTAHYQALSVDDEAAAFAVVPGATLEGTGEPGETVSISTAVSVDGESFTYERKKEVGDDGRFAVTVAYPGAYSVGDDRLEVSEEDVTKGLILNLESKGEDA